MKNILTMVLVLFVVSCSTTQEQKEQQFRIGKYLYMTDNAVLHTKKDCIGITLAKDENGHRVYGLSYYSWGFNNLP